MHGRKQRRNNHQPPNGSLNYTTHTDYESDTAYLSDMPQQSPPPLRSNEELNLSVCRRHNPAITAILSLANYAVIYTFSPVSSSWEKINIEGTLFVCELTPGSLGEKRYNAFLLNRRGLNNFDCPLTSAENVEITDEYVILKQDKESNVPRPNQINDYVVYGIWIYSEPNTSTAETRSTNAQIISECAARAGVSMKEVKARVQAARQDGLQVAAAAAETQVAPTEEVQGGIPMGRTLSLKDMFGQQRAQDDEWSVRAHHDPPSQFPFHPQAPVQQHPQAPVQQQQQHHAMQNMPHMQQGPHQLIPAHPQMHSPAMALQQQHFHQQGFQLQQQQFQQQQQLLRQQQAFLQQQQQMHQQYLQQRPAQQGGPQSPPQAQPNPNLLNLFQRAMEPQGPGEQ